MYVIIESHFVPLEGKFLLIALFIVRIILNVIVHASNAHKCPLNNGVSIAQKCAVILSNTSIILFSTCCENVVEVFESLTKSF